MLITSHKTGIYSGLKCNYTQVLWAKSKKNHS